MTESTAPERTEWTTDQMREDFTVDGFAYGFVAVTRRADGAKGSLNFERRDDQRVYYGWVAA